MRAALDHCILIRARSHAVLRDCCCAAFTALTPVLFLVELAVTALLHYAYCRFLKKAGFK